MLISLQTATNKYQKIFKKKQVNNKYPDCISAIKPVPHSKEVPIPSPPSTSALSEDAPILI